MSNTKMIGSRIRPDLEQRIRDAAARERRTVSDWIRCRLEDAVAVQAAQQPSEAA
jgi:uncharacterized protein (DUF1778 family)